MVAIYFYLDRAVITRARLTTESNAIIAIAGIATTLSPLAPTVMVIANV